jgi:hypothetical protein
MKKLNKRFNKKLNKRFNKKLNEKFDKKLNLHEDCRKTIFSTGNAIFLVKKTKPLAEDTISSVDDTTSSIEKTIYSTQEESLTKEITSSNKEARSLIIEDYSAFSNESFLMNVLGIDCPNLNCFKEIAKEAGYSEWECSDIITEFFVDCDMNPFDPKHRPLDIVAILNNHILNKAREDLLELKNVDICDKDISYYANYFCYCLQCDEIDAKKIISVIESIPDDKRSKEIKRLYNSLLELI